MVSETNIFGVCASVEMSFMSQLTQHSKETIRLLLNSSIRPQSSFYIILRRGGDFGAFNQCSNAPMVAVMVTMSRKMTVDDGVAG